MGCPDGVSALSLHNSRNPRQLTVQLGEWSLYTRPPGSVAVGVVSVAFHPSYTGDALQGADVALLKLARPVRFSRTIRPVLLAWSGFRLSPGTLCWVTGWGDVRESGGWGHWVVAEHRVLGAEGYAWACPIVPPGAQSPADGPAC